MPAAPEPITSTSVSIRTGSVLVAPALMRRTSIGRQFQDPLKFLLVGRGDHTGRRGKVLRGTLGFVLPKRSPLLLGFVLPKCFPPKYSRRFRVVRLRAGCSTRAASLPLNAGEARAIVPGEGAPGRLLGNVPPVRGGRSADRRWCGTPHPVARPYDRAGPSSGRERPAHDAGRRAFRRFTAAFFLGPRTAFWKRKEPFARSP